MNKKLKKLGYTFFSLLLAHLPATVWGQQAERDLIYLDTSRVKAFFVSPLASNRSTENMWIDIVVCSDPSDTQSCDKVIQRIPIAKLLSKGALSWTSDFDGVVRLEYKDHLTKEKSIRLASTMISEELWFPRIELCRSAFEKVDCQYNLILDEGTFSLKLKVLFFRANNQ